MEKNDLDLAITDFDRAIELDPADALAYINRGFAYAEIGDLDRAIADYTEVLRISNDPNVR